MARWAIFILCWTAVAAGATRVLVTVLDGKPGQPVAGLTAGDFDVTDGIAPKRVEGVEALAGPLDILFLVDTSMVGALVQPAAESIIGQLRAKERMALVTFDNSANWIQDFTSSRDSLRAAMAKARYENDPRLLDGLYAALDGGFPVGGFRRVLVLLTTGIEGASRAEEKDIVRMARNKSVSIYPVFLHGSSRGMFEKISGKTGGAAFSLRDLKRTAGDKAAERVFQAIRAPYVLTLSGDLALSEKLTVTVRGREKAMTSTLPLD
ncbi:MAG: VWA domain-containing protein [Acidobacteria bacterium]|nr:VWA domain-containing protein [Acidobacteriota bacterium]